MSQQKSCLLFCRQLNVENLLQLAMNTTLQMLSIDLEYLSNKIEMPLYESTGKQSYRPRENTYNNSFMHTHMVQHKMLPLKPPNEVLILGKTSKLMHYALTFTAEPDSSTLERNACVRKGLNFSGLAGSQAQASQSVAGMSMIEEATEIDTSRGSVPTCNK
jgi:hypothetical protein